MKIHLFYWLAVPVVLAVCVWIGYQVGYHKASLDFVRLATFNSPAILPHNTQSSAPNASSSTDSAPTTHDATQSQQSTDTQRATLSSLVPETMVLTLIDVMPEMQLAALMQQTTHIPVDKLRSVTDPRTLAKQLLVASDLLDATDAPFIADTMLGYSDLQVSAHINAARRPVQADKPIYAGRTRLYASFETLAEQVQEPHYLIKIVKQGVPDTVVYFKFFAFTDNKRQYIWVERDWLAGDYRVELFVLGDVLERVQTTYFTVLPRAVSHETSERPLKILSTFTPDTQR